MKNTEEITNSRQSMYQWNECDSLDWLLSPVSVDSFLENHWERSCLVVNRQDKEYYKDLLTFGDVNNFLSRNDIRYPYLRLVKDGKELPLVDYADDFVYGSNIFPGLLDNDKVMHHYSQGATLSFQIFQKCMQGLSLFCNAIEARLQFQTQVNIFVTPPHSKGFTAHYDDHSFFIFQIDGTKIWTLYDEHTTLPLPEFRKTASSPNLANPKEVVLNSGDLLYVPKGVYHEARTNDTTSTHITLGIFPFTWLQVLEQLVENLKQDIRFRRSPSSYILSDGIPASLDSEFTVLLDDVAKAKATPLIKELMRKAASKQIVDGKDRLLDITNAGNLTENSQIYRRPILCQIERIDRKIRLNFYDKSLVFPEIALESIRQIVESETFFVNQLPRILDQESNLKIVKKLLIEGLLSTHPR